MMRGDEKAAPYKRRARSRGPGTPGSTQARASHLQRRVPGTLDKTQER